MACLLLVPCALLSIVCPLPCLSPFFLPHYCLSCSTCVSLITLLMFLPIYPPGVCNSVLIRCFTSQSPLQSRLRSGSPQSLLRSGRAHRVHSRAHSSPGALRVHSSARSRTGAFRNHSRARSSQAVVLCSSLVASCSAGPALAPLSTSVSRLSSTPQAWPTVPTPVPPPLCHPPRLLFCAPVFVTVLGWCALDCHQRSLCLCVEHMACCWCHVLSCLLSVPSHPVTSSLFKLFHLCLPRYPPRLSP